MKPFFRCVAGAMLLVWAAAVTVCSAQCSDSHSESANELHAAAANSQSHDSNNHHDDSFCHSLHSLCPASAGKILVKPDFGLAFAQSFVSSALLSALTQPQTVVSGQPPDFNPVFTPELSLGPAFRSLAPPALA